MIFMVQIKTTDAQATLIPEEDLAFAMLADSENEVWTFVDRLMPAHGIASVSWRS